MDINLQYMCVYIYRSAPGYPILYLIPDATPPSSSSTAAYGTDRSTLTVTTSGLSERVVSYKRIGARERPTSMERAVDTQERE